MKRIQWVALFLAVFPSLTTPVLTGTAWCGTERRSILVVVSEEGEPYRSVIGAMTADLADKGYVKDDNLTIQYHSLDHYEGRAKRVLEQEAKATHDLVAVFGTIATIAFKELLLDNPKYPKVVFSTITDPVGVGVIDGFSSAPKANFTGVAYPVPIKERFAFIRKLMPKARKIGLIYADMPQSHSYNQWIRDFLKTDPEFKDYEVLFREVPFVKSKGGMIRMGEESLKHIRELDSQVDLFLSANDQLGLQPFFPKNVHETATKPLVGVGRHDVMERRGAAMCIYPVPEGIGRQTAAIVKRLLDGASVKEVLPEETKEFGIAFDMDEIRRFGIVIPPDLLEKAGNNIVGTR